MHRARGMTTLENSQRVPCKNKCTQYPTKTSAEKQAWINKSPVHPAVQGDEMNSCPQRSHRASQGCQTARQGQNRKVKTAHSCDRKQKKQALLPQRDKPTAPCSGKPAPRYPNQWPHLQPHKQVLSPPRAPAQAPSAAPAREATKEAGGKKEENDRRKGEDGHERSKRGDQDA